MYRPPPAIDLAAGFLRERDNRDMILEIDVHEEGALLVREVALHDEEAALQRLRAGPFDRSEHVGLILPPKRADFDLAAVAQKLACGVVDRPQTLGLVSRQTRAAVSFGVRR